MLVVGNSKKNRVTSRERRREVLLRFVSSSVIMPLRSIRRTYNRVAIQGDAHDDGREQNDNSLDEPLSPSSSFDGEDGEKMNNDRDETPLNQSGLTRPPIVNEINVTLLDGATKKFILRCDPAWTVAQFKAASALLTKVPPKSQRLIHMGKLLQDDETLGECGINESEKIVHLFPKPNVVINNNNNGDDNGNEDNIMDNEGGGAHVPQIVLDAEEASRRSQILVLSSTEIFEAQHRVKIFSFLLMIISSMELLTLMTLFMGVEAEENPYGYGSGGEVPPGNPTDAPPSPSQNMQIRTWQNSDYADAVVSAFGLYVSLLGIKATTENTLKLAKQYFGCIIIAAIASNCYYYYLNVQQEERYAQQNNKPIGQNQLYTDAFVGVLLPLSLWSLCVIRAYQFQSLIREAEQEAEERTRNLMQSAGGDGGGDVSVDVSLPYGSGETVTSQSSPSEYNDLELRIEHGVSA